MQPRDSLNVALTPKRIGECVSLGRYRSAREAVRTALRLLQREEPLAAPIAPDEPRPVSDVSANDGGRTEISHAVELAASAAQATAAGINARAAWAGSAEFGASLGRRIAEGQARLITSRVALVALQHASAGLNAAHAAAALREVDLRAVIEGAIGGAIVTTDRTGLVIAWNAGARRLGGWDEEAALGMELASSLAPDSAQSSEAPAADAASFLSGAGVLREGWLQRRDGTRIKAGIEAMPLLADGEPDPVGVVWMLRDRSARCARVRLASPPISPRRRSCSESSAIWSARETRHRSTHASSRWPPD